MLSKQKIKFISSLFHKKYRDETALFVAQGAKAIEDIAAYLPCKLLVGTADWLATTPISADETLDVASRDELKKITTLNSPPEAIALFEQRAADSPLSAAASELVLMLDGVQDPGNLGTIVRLADWFGVRHIVCSPQTADIYNPKVVQATMGAIARVGVYYTELLPFLAELPADSPIYGTFLEAPNIYSQPLGSHGIIVMGNEGQGISDEVARRVNRGLFIPNFPMGAATSESLNVAVATSIVLSEFRRRAF